jgi:hypothetical protein
MAAPWYMVAWELLDGSLRGWSRRLQAIVRTLRLARLLLVVGILAVLASAVVGLLWPPWFPLAYAIAAVALVVPLALCLVLVGLPLRARSVIRLIDKGYPENAKELLLRLAARKLRDESIETEELLLETAINEGRKLVRRMRSEEGQEGNAEPPAGAPPF